MDATKTLTIRRRAAAEIDRRFKILKRAIRATIVGEGGFFANAAQPAADGRFVFLRDPEKIDEFNKWLSEEIQNEILAIEGGKEVENHWLNMSVGSAYDRGAKKARLSVERSLPNLDKIPDYHPLQREEHIDRSQLLYTRTFENLRGVTEAMSTQISRELANGMINGHNPNKIARAMEDRVDKIGITRAKLIARTEIIEAHNRAAIVEGELLAAETGEEIKYKWLTSIDGRERATHHDRHKKIYAKDEVDGLLGEPNCRCSVSAYVDIDGLLEREDLEAVDEESLPEFELSDVELSDRDSFGKTYKSASIAGRNFKNVDRSENVGSLGDISPLQEVAIYDYTRDDYYEINRHLRGIDELEGIELENYMKKASAISELIDGASPVDSDIILFRNMRSPIEYSEGQIFLDKGFSSTTKLSQTYSLAPTKGDNVYKTTILVPQGSKGLAGIQGYSQAENEAEVLFDANSEYKVLQINDLGKGQAELVLLYQGINNPK